MHVELLRITPDAEALIEYAGRVCYRSTGHGDPATFIRARLRDGHESITEHASATFVISGISRACAEQLKRHRIASYSQESQRYVPQTATDCVTPDAISAHPEARRVFGIAQRVAARCYSDLLAHGIKPEDARAVLPMATETRLVMTMNFRELRHFFRLRLSNAAQAEIQHLAAWCLALVAPHAPVVFEEFE